MASSVDDLGMSVTIGNKSWTTSTLVVSSCNSAVVHRGTNRVYNSPPVNVQSNNDKSIFLNCESHETFSNLFNTPRLSTASQNIRSIAPTTNTQSLTSPVKKKIHQKAYVKPFNKFDENSNCTMPSRNHVPGIGELFYPVMGNTAHQPTLKRGVTHTTGYDQREATHQPMTSAQNMHAYQYNGLPFPGIVNSNIQHYQPPGIHHYGSQGPDLYEMILQYYAASGNNNNFMTPLTTYQLYQTSQLQLNAPHPLTSMLNFNKSSSFIPWSSWLLAYQQQSLLQSQYVKNSQIESVKKTSNSTLESSENNRSDPSHDVKWRENLSCNHGNGQRYSSPVASSTVSKMHDGMSSSNESHSAYKDYTYLNMEQNSTFQANLGFKNSLQYDRGSTSYFEPNDTPKCSVSCVYPRSYSVSDANNNILSTEKNFVPEATSHTDKEENLHLKKNSEEKSYKSRESMQMLIEHETLIKKNKLNTFSQPPVFDRSAKSSSEEKCHSNGNSALVVHNSEHFVHKVGTCPPMNYLRDTTLSGEKYNLRKTIQAQGEYIHKKSTASANQRSTGSIPNYDGEQGYSSGIFWNNAEKNELLSLYQQYGDDALCNSGTEKSNQSSAAVCDSSRHDVDGSSMSMFLPNENVSEMWNRGQYLNDSVSDDESTYSTDIHSIYRDTDDTDSAYSPQFNPV